jgi:hypothetical protein
MNYVYFTIFWRMVARQDFLHYQRSPEENNFLFLSTMAVFLDGILTRDVQMPNRDRKYVVHLLH